MRALAAYLLKHNSRAAFLVLICAALSFYAVPIGWIGSIILGFITLNKGARTGGYVLLWALLPALTFLIAGLGWFLPIVSIAINLMIWFFAVLMRQKFSWQLILQIAVLIGIIIVAISHATIFNLQSWWLAKITNAFEQISSVLTANISNSQIQSGIAFMAKIAMGVQVAFTIFTALSYLFIARWWQNKLNNSNFLAVEFYSLRMSKVFSLLLFFCLLGIWANNYFAWDVLPIIVFAFLLAGLSLWHSFAVRQRGRVLLVAIVYVLLVFFFPYITGILVLAALVDSWYDFRVRSLGILE